MSPKIKLPSIQEFTTKIGAPPTLVNDHYTSAGALPYQISAQYQRLNLQPSLGLLAPLSQTPSQQSQSPTQAQILPAPVISNQHGPAESRIAQPPIILPALVPSQQHYTVNGPVHDQSRDSSPSQSRNSSILSNSASYVTGAAPPSQPQPQPQHYGVSINAFPQHHQLQPQPQPQPQPQQLPPMGMPMNMTPTPITHPMDRQMSSLGMPSAQHAQSIPMHGHQSPHIYHHYPQHNMAFAQSKKKRPRRKANEMIRLYACNYENCQNSYGTLNHLNAHIQFKKHGQKRKPEEFRQIRELYKLQNKKNNGELVAGMPGLGNLEHFQRNGIEVPIFHQQRGYNGYGRLDHTLK